MLLELMILIQVKGFINMNAETIQEVWHVNDAIFNKFYAL